MILVRDSTFLIAALFFGMSFSLLVKIEWSLFTFDYRCAFHAYADSTYAKHLENGGQSIYGTIGGPTPIPMSTPSQANGAREYQQSVIEVSEDSINSIEKVEEWNNVSASSPSSGGGGGGGGKRMSNAATPSPRENGKWAWPWG